MVFEAIFVPVKFNTGLDLEVYIYHDLYIVEGVSGDDVDVLRYIIGVEDGDRSRESSPINQ